MNIELFVPRLVHSLILLEEPGFKRVQIIFVCLDLGMGSAHFWLNRFKVQAFWRGSKGFEIQFWWMNLGSIEFEV